MVWMRETRINTFMQMELEAYLNEIDWMIICHNCEAFNCPQEKIPARPLPIPPNCIDNLQRRLVKVNKGILPPTLKMILKAYYYLPARQAPVTSPAVQPNDMMVRHRDGEHSPLERPQASDEKKKVAADGTLSTDQGGDFFFQTEVGKDPETPQITAHHFALVIDRQQREVTTRSTEKGRHHPTQAEFWGNPTATTAQVAAREEAVIGRHQRETTSTEQNRQFSPGGRRVNCSFLPSGYVAFCMLSCAFSVLPYYNFPCYHTSC